MSQPIVPSITDEQISEIERFANFGGDYLKVKNSAVTGLLARLRAAEKDAARYRFIKDECDRRWDIMYQDVEIIVPAQNFDDCDDLDGLVDAAMGQQP